MTNNEEEMMMTDSLCFPLLSVLHMDEGPLYSGTGQMGPLYPGTGQTGPLYPGAGQMGPLYPGAGQMGPLIQAQAR